MRAIQWLASRYHELGGELSSSVALEEEENPFLSPPSTPPSTHDTGAENRAKDSESNKEEPLQLLLELAAGRLGAGVDGLHTSLALIGGDFNGLTSMRVRRAFAAALRAHLAAVRLDSVFRFGRPKYVAGVPRSIVGGNSGGKNGFPDGTSGVSSPGRLALPLVQNWALFRKYTVTLWIRPEIDSADVIDDDGLSPGPVTLFRLRSMEGIGVEARLSSTASAGDVGHNREMDLVVTSFLRVSAQKSFSVKGKLPAPTPMATSMESDAVETGTSVGGSIAEGVRLGGWRFIVISHGQPYVKRSGKLRISVDGEVMLETELPYPPGTGQGSKDPLSR